MKFYRFVRAITAGLGLAVLLATIAKAVLPTPDTGLRLTDWFALQQAITFDNQVGFATVTNAVANTQASCTALVFPMNNITTATTQANASFCLPTATAGREVYIGNGSGVTINIFGSNTPFVAGTQDTINTTAGSTAYTSTTTTKNANCFAPANGTWFCTAGN